MTMTVQTLDHYPKVEIFKIFMLVVLVSVLFWPGLVKLVAAWDTKPQCSHADPGVAAAFYRGRDSIRHIGEPVTAPVFGRDYYRGVGMEYFPGRIVPLSFSGLYVSDPGYDLSELDKPAENTGNQAGGGCDAGARNPDTPGGESAAFCEFPAGGRRSLQRDEIADDLPDAVHITGIFFTLSSL